MLIIVVELVHNREMVVIGVSGAYNWWSSGSTAIAPECVPYIPGHLTIVWGIYPCHIYQSSVGAPNTLSCLLQHATSAPFYVEKHAVQL